MWVTFSEIVRVISATVYIICRIVSGFLTLLGCTQLIAFDTPWELATEVWWTTKRLTVITLTCWLVDLVFFPLYDDARHNSFDLEYVAKFSAVLKSYNTHREFDSNYLCTRSFVPFYNLDNLHTGNSWNFMSACVSSMVTLTEMTLRTWRGLTASGNVYVC